MGRYIERSRNSIDTAIKDDDKCTIFLAISTLSIIDISVFYNPVLINSSNLSLMDGALYKPDPTIVISTPVS